MIILPIFVTLLSLFFAFWPNINEFKNSDYITIVIVMRFLYILPISMVWISYFSR